MALEDKLSDALKDIGNLGGVLSELGTTTDIPQRESLYRTAAVIIGGRDDPRNGNIAFKELITKNPEGAYAVIDGAISERLDSTYKIVEEEGERKRKTVEDEYKRQVNEISTIVAEKLDEKIGRLDKEDRERKYKVVDLLSQYFGSVINIPQDLSQAREVLAQAFKIPSYLITETSINDIKYVAVRLATADYLEKTNGTYRIDRTKLKELIEKNIRAGAILYSQATQKENK